MQWVFSTQMDVACCHDIKVGRPLSCVFAHVLDKGTHTWRRLTGKKTSWQHNICLCAENSLHEFEFALNLNLNKNLWRHHMGTCAVWSPLTNKPWKERATNVNNSCNMTEPAITKKNYFTPKNTCYTIQHGICTKNTVIWEIFVWKIFRVKNVRVKKFL